jgi:signal transduction histidine kinase/CheY-like chemotaxis protein
MPPTLPPSSRDLQDSRRQETLSGQVRLLFASANTTFGVTVLAATMVAGLQWSLIPGSVVLGWWACMIVVAVARYVLAQRYRRAAPQHADAGRWLSAFAMGAGIAGIGWGSAGILLYPESHLANQVFLVFVLGGMMLGAASILAPRPEAFLTFLIPTGLGPAIRLLIKGDETHSAMGLLAVVFTIATVVTTYRIYLTVSSSLGLQFENRDLVGDLLAAKCQAEALNQALENRVQERTAELLKSTEHLLAEIAHREQMEEELVRARKLESLGVMAGGIAHDFNNFLTVVQGNVELAKSQLDPEEPVQKNLNQTVEACRRAAFLSSQLLTFAKGGAPVRRVVSMSKLVLDAVQLARAGASISISVNIADDLHFALVDPTQVSQVLLNLLLNARQSMPEGGIIEVRAENAESSDTGPSVQISVRDYGCGIPHDVLPRIFDPYFTTKRGGNGLGLATAYAIVAKHGGQISVKSKPGQGSTFLIELPASLEGPAAEAPTPKQTYRGRERILVMDDEAAVRNLLNAVLSRLGYDVQTAGDGAEAIALYEEAQAADRRFEAVLLDLTVSGGMGGIEAAIKLKEMDPAAKLIVSSGYSDAPVMSDFALYGFDGVIPKPWTATEVSEVLQRVLVREPDRKSD